MEKFDFKAKGAAFKLPFWARPAEDGGAAGNGEVKMAAAFGLISSTASTTRLKTSLRGT